MKMEVMKMQVKKMSFKKMSVKKMQAKKMQVKKNPPVDTPKSEFLVFEENPPSNFFFLRVSAFIQL